MLMVYDDEMSLDTDASSIFANQEQGRRKCKEEEEEEEAKAAKKKQRKRRKIKKDTRVIFDKSWVHM